MHPQYEGKFPKIISLEIQFEEQSTIEQLL